MKRHSAMIIFVIGACCFGLNPLFVKLGYADGWSLGEINVVQVIIALTVLWIVGILSIKRHPWVIRKLTGKKVISLIVAGSFTGLTSILYYGAMQYLPASLAVVLLFQFVWVGVLFDWIFNRQKPTKQTVLAVMLTLVGVCFAAGLWNGGFSDISLIGFVLGIGSAFSYTAFVFVSGRVATDVPATIRTPIMITGAGILTFIVFPPHLTLNEGVLEGNIWIYAAGVALCGLILTPFLFAISTPHLSGSFATILGSVELPVSVIVAAIGLSEHITLSRWFGVILILLAIVLGELRSIWKYIQIKKHNVDRSRQYGA
ncbi:EamA family transporter [Oceanobacillus senegalensis]|uniref:EamA family transporter n=1 Tax=Oceanobacillus senegalensis TaxID=1936063 RepID=UPI000A3084F5|nr:DMT family transporter [Oceanobacillus senegalensis]